MSLTLIRVVDLFTFYHGSKWNKQRGCVTCCGQWSFQVSFWCFNVAAWYFEEILLDLRECSDVLVECE